MGNTTIEYTVLCKRCGDPKKPVGYSGMMYTKMKEFGHSRPEYCEDCRKALLAEKMTMGAAYYSLDTIPEADLSVALPGELGKVYHPDRPHVKSEKEKAFDASKFGATPGKIVEIYDWLKDPKHQVVIVKGGTGSGKSTALPYWLIFPPEGVPKDFFTRDGQIAITQPRIVATTGVSKYLGTLVGSSVGKGFDIGYRYSKDRNADRFNAAFMATDGTLINMIKMGQLSELSVVMIDEAHERSLNIDIILHLLKDQLPLYPHLKLLIVSATINAESFLDYFGKDTATLVEFEPKSKFTYVCHFADEKEKLDYENPNRLKKQVVQAMVRKIVWLLGEQANKRKPYGHILAFLQGVKPIEEAVEAIRVVVAGDPKLKNMVEILPLYSDLTEEESDRAIGKSESSKIRVIISTNVAEASITVEGVVYVVESGIENQAQWEVANSKKSVELRIISKANARQRWGRSGRTRDGEVYCLYTENQFESMLNFPIPAIQRSSMEEIILKLKELGIDDYDKDWIDAPVSEELNRSISSLKSSGAIDEKDMLTEYGALLGQFGYPATLADLVIMADRFGCAVEVATILPIIKSGGARAFLRRETSWDEPTKQKVGQIQEVLWKGCRDDVEFIFRLYNFWENPPTLSNDDKSLKKGIRERRSDFADAFYLNFEVFEEEIEKEKGQVLRLLSGHRKDKSTRKLQFELLNRVRIILAFSVPYKVVADGVYIFDPRLEITPGAVASCQLALQDDLVKKLAELKKKKVSSLKIALDMKPWVKGDESLDEVLKRVLTKPVLPVIDRKSFEEFLAKYKVGDELEMFVVGYAEHAGDFRVSLVVKESTTGYETWLTPSDISFTQSSAVVKQIPIGTKLKVVVKEEVIEKSFVRLSCLPLVEAMIHKTYSAQKKVDGQIFTRAKLIDIRTDKRLVFVAELSKPEEGYVLVIHANEKVLSKPINNYKVGEIYMVSFRVDSQFDFKSDLAVIPRKIAEYIKTPKSLLNWTNGKLIFKGKMRYSVLLELASYDSDISYLAALDFLYLSSNMNWVSKVIDSGWIEEMKSQYAIGATVNVKVKKVLGVGLSVELTDGQIGFIRVNNSNNFAKEGEILKAKVLNFDEQRQSVNLSFTASENSAVKKFAVGQEREGVVDGLADYGAFVKLEMGYSGLIHISKMGRRIKHPNEILSKGDKVLVEVIGIENSGGKTKISLRLISVVSRRT